ncbi:MAG: hypothetical protein JWL58_7270 [Streptosporangiaceae bacterium]|jgi:hypothetical protein|nr:hypothetical protein [Streptosporangiaceae bacterium]
MRVARNKETSYGLAPAPVLSTRGAGTDPGNGRVSRRRAILRSSQTMSAMAPAVAQAGMAVATTSRRPAR